MSLDPLTHAALARAVSPATATIEISIELNHKIANLKDITVIDNSSLAIEQIAEEIKQGIKE